MAARLLEEADGDGEEAVAPTLSRRGGDDQSPGGGGGGNLFLTCLRLRFEERGSWSEALAEPGELPEEEEEEEESPAMAPSMSSPTMAASPSWRDRMGLPAKGATLRVLRRRVQGLILQQRAAKAFCAAGGDGEDGSPRDSTPSMGRSLSTRSMGRSLSTRSVSFSLGASMCGTLSARGAGGPPSFGVSGVGIEVLPGPAGSPGALARRRSDAPASAPGLALTARPLRPASSGLWRRGGPRRYAFELEVLEAARGGTRSLRMGFAWAPGEAEGLAGAERLPLAFVAGGELPRAHLCGRELVEELGWRPVLHVRERSAVCAALEVSEVEGGAFALRLAILQDGTRRAEICTEVGRGDCALHAALSDPELHPSGVVDVCGNVRSVQLLPSPSEAHRGCLA